MTQDTLMVVHLTVKQEGDNFFVTSPNLDGLNVYGVGVEATYQSVVKMVKALYSYNRGIEVEVHPATSNDKEIPNTMHLCNEVVVRLKAA